MTSTAAAPFLRRALSKFWASVTGTKSTVSLAAAAGFAFGGLLVDKQGTLYWGSVGFSTDRAVCSRIALLDRFAEDVQRMKKNSADDLALFQDSKTPANQRQAILEKTVDLYLAEPCYDILFGEHFVFFGDNGNATIMTRQDFCKSLDNWTRILNMGSFHARVEEHQLGYNELR